METVQETQSQEFTFQAEIAQLLHLLAHSLYQSKEIAIRELVSNASDALDKMRFVALTDQSYRDDSPLEIVIVGDKDAKELIIRDNGIGMTHDEIVTNLGTIAHSGSRKFLESAKNTDAKTALSLIGQFGVGFYSAFMIADTVRVRSRSYKDTQGWEWVSDGTGKFRVSPVEGLSRGTEVVLHLKDDVKFLAEDWKIKSIIRTYSSFIPHPIKVGGELANSQKPIWVEPKRQVTDEQYTQFYQHLTHHSDEKPLWHLHLSADSPIQFHAILYCPPTNLEESGFGRQEHGISLCAKRVLVQNDCRDLLPEYLRFLHGIVDSEDLPLNVSRETLQDNTVIRKIKNSLVKSVLDKLDSIASESPKDLLTFLEQFGPILKEAVARDSMNRDRVAKLLRFRSSHSDELTSLDDYIERMVEGQSKIYYLGGPNIDAIRTSPNTEVFRRRGIELLYLTEPVDEFVMSTLGSYDSKPLISIDSADVELPPETEKDKEKENEEKAPEEPPSSTALGRVLTLFKEALGDRVQEVRESKRLTSSACCLVNAEGGLSTQMQRLLKLANRDFQTMSRVLEINPTSPLIKRLALLGANSDNDAFIKDCALQLWANSLLLEGTVAEPEGMVKRNQAFMEEAAAKRSAIVF